MTNERKKTGQINVSIFSEVLRDCSLDTFDVQKGDIIILSSDGLWDVVKADQLQAIMERYTTGVSLNCSKKIIFTFFCVGFTRFSR